MVPEAPLEQTEDGLLPAGEGWFVLNAREAAWRRWEGMGKWPRLEGETPIFPQLGLGLTVLEPGEPMTMYHWETDQEDFLVLSGEALAIVEGEERLLRQWDFLHCPAGTNHAIVGAGAGPCVVFAVGARENHTYCTPDGRIEGTDDWGAYTVDEAALRHGAGIDEETNDANVAYGRFPERVSSRYGDGWLPDFSHLESDP
ncbi:MAG: cupin domain-containing protein [Gaiellaceae bacterium]